MTISQQEDPARSLREKAKEAIQLAMRSRWEEAVAVNRSIIELAPGDAEAHNRLGKALLELGRYEEARSAFQRALALKSSNTIARKNLERLERLEARGPRMVRGGKMSAALFLEESGKASVARVQDLAPRDVLATLSAGDPVHLSLEGNAVWVESPHEERLGHLEPRLALRLSRLMGGGNRYTAAVTSAAERELVIIIREVYQHPDLAEVISFPGKAAEGYHPYLEELPIPYERGEEEDEAILDRDDSGEEGRGARGSSPYPLSRSGTEEEEEEF